MASSSPVSWEYFMYALYINKLNCIIVLWIIPYLLYNFQYCPSMGCTVNAMDQLSVMCPLMVIKPNTGTAHEGTARLLEDLSPKLVDCWLDCTVIFRPHHLLYILILVIFMVLRSSTNRVAVTQRTKTQFGTRAFSVSGPAIWNSLPLTLRPIDSHQCFRRHLKTYVFNMAFN